MAYATDEVVEIQEKVITEIQTGRSLRQVCGDDGMPNFRTVQRWIVSDGQFAVRYARARTAQADTLFDRMEAVEEAVSAISGALAAAQSRLVDVVDVTHRALPGIVQDVQGEDDVS